MNRRSFLAVISSVVALPKLALGAFRSDAKPSPRIEPKFLASTVVLTSPDVRWLDHPVYATYESGGFATFARDGTIRSTIFPGKVDLRAFPHLREHVDLRCGCWRSKIYVVASERIAAGSFVVWATDPPDGTVRTASDWKWLAVASESAERDDKLTAVVSGKAFVRVIGSTDMLNS